MRVCVCWFLAGRSKKTYKTPPAPRFCRLLTRRLPPRAVARQQSHAREGSNHIKLPPLPPRGGGGAPCQVVRQPPSDPSAYRRRRRRRRQRRGGGRKSRTSSAISDLAASTSVIPSVRHPAVSNDIGGARKSQGGSLTCRPSPWLSVASPPSPSVATIAILSDVVQSRRQQPTIYLGRCWQKHRHCLCSCCRRPCHGHRPCPLSSSSSPIVVVVLAHCRRCCRHHRRRRRRRPLPSLVDC